MDADRECPDSHSDIFLYDLWPGTAKGENEVNQYAFKGVRFCANTTDDHLTGEQDSITAFTFEASDELFSAAPHIGLNNLNDFWFPNGDS